MRRGELDALARDYAGGAETRGEIVIVVAPPADEATDAAEVDELLRRALARVSVKDAVGEVALATGRPRREVYQRALDARQGCRRCRAMNASRRLPKAAPVAKAAPRPERQVAFQLGISAESRAAAC